MTESNSAEQMGAADVKGRGGTGKQRDKSSMFANENGNVLCAIHNAREGGGGESGEREGERGFAFFRGTQIITSEHGQSVVP